MPSTINAVKRFLAVLGIAVLGSQAGHLLAYELRYGAAAQQLQSTGAHAYFPTLMKTLLGAVAMVVIAALLTIGFARLAAGRKVEPHSAPSFLRLLAGLYTVQLALFFTQEMLEGSPASQIMMWGLLGQLPAAAAGALALRWLLARLGPALAWLGRYVAAPQLLPLTPALALRPLPIAAPPTGDWIAGSITRRGPPSF